jgi:hypothetical protein
VGVAVCGAAAVESDEPFRVRLRNASGATIQDQNGRVTISNDDAAAALPTVAINDVTAPEGNTGTSARQFAATLSAASSQTVTVQFAFAAPPTDAATRGTACGAGIDVALAASGTLTFPPSVTTQPIPFTVCGDVVDENDEAFDVVLSSPAGATIGDGTGRGTITDNDAGPALPSLSVSNGTKVEGTTGTTQTQHMGFTVTLSAASSQPVRVSLATTSTGSAILGATCAPTVDLQQLQATITFPPDVQSLPLGVTLCGDALDEPDETFDIVLSNPTGATIADGTGRGTITDDDLPGPPTDLTVDVRQAGAAPAIATGTNVAFVFTVANVGSTSVTNVVTRVSIPFGFTALVPSAAAGTGITCDGVGRVAGSTDPHIVRCTATNVAFNSQKEFRITAAAPATITGSSQSFTVTAQVDPDATISEGTAGEGNNSDNLTVSIVTMADLDVDLPNAPGQALTTQVAPDLVYLANVDNRGDRAASNLLVRFTLPKDVAFVRVEENKLGTCLQNSTASDGSLHVNCTLSSLPAGERRSVRIIARFPGLVPDGVQVTFAAAVDPNNSVPERNETDNTAFMITTVRARSDLQLSGTARNFETAVGPIFDAGDLFAIQLKLRVKNNGPFASAPTIVEATWPAGFSAALVGCFNRCNVPAIAPGQDVSVPFFAVHSLNSGQIRVTPTVDPQQRIFDPILGNNTLTFDKDLSVLEDP